ncbi:hypothetical protein [Leifsonia sp. NPDC077715]|uniref:hypothetical protein n=1 Tax=Leifsonia sp. NPDC077715 TaxID=3155539 RepID=UPI003433ABD0
MSNMVNLEAEGEVDGLDEASSGVPEPNNAVDFTMDYAMPTVIPRPVRRAAVVAVILSVPLPVVAIPIAHVTSRQLRQRGESGVPLVRAALIASYLSLSLVALVAINVVITLAT